MEQVVTGAVVQGNIRRGTTEVLQFLKKHFDKVILSTWDDENLDNLKIEGLEVVTNKKPIAPGFSHRNFQRASTAAGLRRARQLGVTHVLKWRTDMLPTKMSVPMLLRFSSEAVQPGMDSRYVTCAFRNLTVKDDWFSSIPDLFGFGDIDLMLLVWGDDHIDYEKQFNTPAEMINEVGTNWMQREDVEQTYCAESELYAIFKSRLQKRMGQQFDHYLIAKNYLRLINHNKLGICWFGGNNGFRSIIQALEHPWWTELVWKYLRPIKVQRGYPQNGLIRRIMKTYVTNIVIRLNIYYQSRWYKKYLSHVIN